jgi:hypothetical protein
VPSGGGESDCAGAADEASAAGQRGSAAGQAGWAAGLRVPARKRRRTEDRLSLPDEV